MPTDTTPELTPEQLAEIERKFDPETAFRNTGKLLGYVISFILVLMSVYHFYASGFGLVRELVHRGIHLSFVLGLVFLLFGVRKTSDSLPPKAWYRFDGIPLIDIIFAFLAVIASMYLPLLPASALAPVSYTHSEPTRLLSISYAVFCLKKKKKKNNAKTNNKSTN